MMLGVGSMEVASKLSAAPKVRGISPPRSIALSALFAAMMVVGALISIPFFPIPLSLQTFFVYLGVLVLGKKAFLGQAIYLALGLVGLPVFSRGMGGYAVLLGPTGGFLAGFLFGSIVAGVLSNGIGSLGERRGKNSGLRGSDVLVIAICMAIIFGTGWIWLAYWIQWDFLSALWIGILPFLPGDIIKAILALIIAKKVNFEVHK